MKILFITNAAGIDYLSDMTFHGLVMSNHDVTDSRYMWYLSNTITKEQKYNLYGNGFTISGNLPDRKNINRDNLKERIIEKEFDVIVYGSIQRCSDFIDIVCDTYPKNRIIFIDGEDNLDIMTNIKDKGIMFKREQYTNICNPISFAIPTEKLYSGNNIQKKKELSIVKPQFSGSKNFYIFKEENDYYKEYQESMFAITRKKGGWDCLRHYEIIANMCLPFFENYEQKPDTIMTNWPKELQMESNEMYLKKDYSNYDCVMNQFFNYCKDNLTTINLVEYILGKSL